MKHFNITTGIFFSISCMVIPAKLFAMNGLDVMKLVDDVSRLSFNTSASKTKLATCKYAVKKGSIRCKEKPRVSLLEAGQKKYGPGNRDIRSIAIVLEPIKDKGIGILSYEYYDPAKENDVWLYLSAMGKVKRLVTNSNGDDDGGSYFGTEYSVDDVALKKIDEYSYDIRREETYEDRPVWVVEATPTKERAKKTAYEKLVYWVDKEKHIILKEDLFNRSGKLYKQRLNKNWEKVENVWVTKQQIMNNILTRRVTIIKNISVTYNKKVTDEFLTLRSLTDFTFREKNLAALRAFYQ